MKKLCRDNFEAFVLTNSILFYSFTKRYIASQHAIEDILQDCYVKLWDNIDNLEHVSDAKLYLFTMIKNAALNFNKREQRNLFTDSIEKHIYPINNIDTTDNLINEIFEEEANVLLAKAINSLPLNQRKIIVLALKGYKNMEIANMLNTTEDSVKSRKKRAIQKLTAKNTPKSLLFLLL